MIRSLWFKLTVYFTAITLIFLIGFSVVFNAIELKSDFAKSVTPKSVQAIVSSEVPFLIQAVEQKTSPVWLNRVGNDLLYKLHHIELYEGQSFDISLVSQPEIYVQLVDANNQLMFTSQPTFPESINTLFSSHREPSAVASYLMADNHIWVNLPLHNDAGEIQGIVSVLFIVNVDISKFMKDMLTMYFESWPASILACAFIALVCSIVANWFVARPLRRISYVTGEWCKGNLALRINVKKKGGDILDEHGRQLNIVADRLENLLAIRAHAAVMDERNWMAGELHDTVKQNLFALSLQMVVMKHRNRTTEAEFIEHIEEAEHIIRESQRDIKEILTHFYPVDVDGVNLNQRLDTLIEDMRRRYNITILWDVKNIPAMSKQQEHILFRMTQEAISNSIRHGKATRIVLNLFNKDGMLFWNVADNGSGLNQGWQPEANFGLGLTFMSKRVQDMPEGKFTVVNRLEGGAMISAQWLDKTH